MHLTHSTTVLVKFVLASGLYPQFGILDAHNNYRHGSDQMLHTRTKPFTVLHPNSGFGQEPEPLQIRQDADGTSRQHQLVFYGMLLETQKAYVVNSVRVPAMHTLMLLCRRIDTNRDLTLIAFDGWIEIRTADALQAQM